MQELYRITARSTKGRELVLVLTETQLILDPSREFTDEIVGAMEEGKAKAQEAPGVIGWVVDKALGWAGTMIARTFKPHPLSEVDLQVHGSRISLELPGFPRNMNIGSMAVDPAEAYIFEAKFREARTKLLK